MTDILLFCTASGGKLSHASLEVLAAGRQLGGELGNGNLQAALLGPDVEGCGETAVHRGADEVFVVSHPRSQYHEADVILQALERIVQQLSPDVILLPHDELGGGNIYTPACDRGNERLQELYNPLDPAVLRLIHNVIEVAHAAGKGVGLCGELAGQRAAIPVLLGLGLDEFSMTPHAIPVAKQLIRSLNVMEAQRTTEHVLSLPTASAIQDYLASIPQDLVQK